MKKIKVLAILLSNKLLNFLTKLRLFLYYSGVFKIYKVNTFVISIGNISFGGEGKTPITIKIAENVKKKGVKVAIVLRGYKRKSKEKIAIVSDGKKILKDAITSGDEAFLLAKRTKVPVIVGKDRVNACKIAIEKFHPDVILLDDAFQHFKIFRDKDIVVVSEKTFNDKIFLRENFYGLFRADTVILSKVKDKEKLRKFKFKIKKFFNKDLWYADFFIKSFYSPFSGNYYKKLKFDEVTVFCGIGNPDFFKSMLIDKGFKIRKFLKYQDHFFYNDKFYTVINKISLPIITTEKDYVKIDLDKIKNKNFYVTILDVKLKKLD